MVHAADSYYISINGGPQELLNGIETGRMWVPGSPPSNGTPGTPGGVWDTVTLADLDGDGTLDIMALMQTAVSKGSCPPSDLVVVQVSSTGKVVSRLEMTGAVILEAQMPGMQAWQNGNGPHVVFGQPEPAGSVSLRMRKRPELLRTMASESCTFGSAPAPGTVSDVSGLSWYSPPLASALGFSPPGGSDFSAPQSVTAAFASSHVGVDDFDAWLAATALGNGAPQPVSFTFTTVGGDAIVWSETADLGLLDDGPQSSTVLKEKVTIRPERHEIQ